MANRRVQLAALAATLIFAGTVAQAQSELPPSCVGILNDPGLKDSFRQNGAVKFSADTGLGLTLFLGEKSFSLRYEIENAVPLLPNRQKRFSNRSLRVHSETLISDSLNCYTSAKNIAECRSEVDAALEQIQRVQSVRSENNLQLTQVFQCASDGLLAFMNKIPLSPPPQHCSGAVFHIQRQGRSPIEDSVRDFGYQSGAEVPPTEDTRQTAILDGRPTPMPPKIMSIRYHNLEQLNCAVQLQDALKKKGIESEVRPLSPTLKAVPRIVEAWLPKQQQ